MAHHDEEVTNPGRIHPTADFADDSEHEGTEEVTQVDSITDHVSSDHQTPAELEDNPFDSLDGPTVIPR